MSKRAQRAARGEAEHDLGRPVRPEVVVLQLRRHGRRLTFSVIALFAIAVASGVWIGSFTSEWLNILAAIAAALALVLFVVFPLLLWLTERITVSTKRIILRRGIFVRHRSELPLSRVREVRSRHSLIQRMFGSGDIEIFVGTEARLVPDVPAVDLAVDALQALIERNYEESLQFSSDVHGGRGDVAGTNGRTGAAARSGDATRQASWDQQWQDTGAW